MVYDLEQKNSEWGKDGAPFSLTFLHSELSHSEVALFKKTKENTGIKALISTFSCIVQLSSQALPGFMFNILDRPILKMLLPSLMNNNSVSLT